ncbi:hypothetical protein G7Y89_g3596 [Cudoniella acicularis]|uniref:Uncharacterized protein n=1 Tax=Cudoniella acicularis TaxID=354080 RepID=A0A8H4W516_9HELO|nr:hypothetical protein G7Y89_g3596 [Cudoniella acicularis]
MTAKSPKPRPATTFSLAPPPQHVVIGIDFGTTYSGVSWSYSKWSNPDQIEQIHRWAVDMGSTARNQEADKVPSKISYDKWGEIQNWGYKVGPRDEYQASWFKLLLSDEARKKGGEKVEYTKELLIKLKKSPVDVVADYLRCLWRHAVDVIELSLTKIAVENMTFRVVLTLPAKWDHGAEELTRKAAIQAGITAPRRRGPTNFRMVTEPEAAALAAWRESGMEWRPDLRSVMLVEARSYTVESLNPLKLKMCVVPTGGLCGAVYLDEGFDRFLRTYVTSNVYDRIDAVAKAKVFENDWEYNGKKLYNGPGKPPNEFKVDIPGYKPKRPMFGKRPTSTIVLNSSHMDTIFHPVVSEIAVLLVGGFGENNFVLNQLKEAFPNIPIQRPAKARGAVIKGQSTSVETETVTNYISKLSYGTLHDAYFNYYLHDESDKYTCPFEGTLMARNQFTWYLRRVRKMTELLAIHELFTNATSRERASANCNQSRTRGSQKSRHLEI